MRKNFKLPSLTMDSSGRGVRFWLQSSVGVLALLNAAALFFYFAPPGGSQQDLTLQSESLRRQIASARTQTVRLRTVGGQVQLGSEQGAAFEARYILPKREAFQAVIAEIQRMSQAASLVQRDGVFTEEPIEGTADLSLLNITANYEGSYANLMRFLYEADHSPMLLMLDALQATPQKEGHVTTAIRFQAIVRDEPIAAPMGERR